MKSSKFRGLEYRNHNRLLKEYKGTDGIKTSYVRASGYNIVVSVERNGRRLIAAIFGGKSALKRNCHAKTLLQRTFAMFAENARSNPNWQNQRIPRRTENPKGLPWRGSRPRGQTKKTI